MNISRTDSDIWYNHKIIGDVSLGVKSKLLFIVMICCIFIIIESIGAAFSNSIAIFTDVIHLFSDLLGFIFSLISVHLATKKASKEHSYGYIRAEILGALCSVVIIWGMTIWIATRAYTRLMRILRGQPIFLKPSIMVLTATLGLIINLILACTLHSHDHSHMGHDHCHEVKHHSHK